MESLRWVGGTPTRGKARKIGVVLTGIAAPTEVGGGYARDFNAVFPAVARTHGVPLYPNLLAGVARQPSLNQPDGIHPNARGVEEVVRRILPAVETLLARVHAAPAG